VSAGIVAVGLFTVVLGFIWGIIFGTKGRGSVGYGELIIAGAPAFILITLGVLIMAWGIGMP
jgi:hypothetical protein